MTSEERYQQLLEMDRLGVTTGKDQQLLASIAAGETSIADAFPVYVPQPGAERMSFGESYIGPANTNTGANNSSSNDGLTDWERNKNFILQAVSNGTATQGQLDWYNKWVNSGSPDTQAGMLDAQDPNTRVGFGDSYMGPASTPAEPPPAAAPPPAEPTQEQQMNQAFIEFLRQLGLENLVQLFTSGDLSLTGNGGVPTNNQSQGMLTPYVPAPYTPQTVDFSSQLLPMNEVGYDPYRGMYNVPKAMQPGTVANATGLFRYIYGPFGQYPQPMQPYVPQVTPPTIAPNV